MSDKSIDLITEHIARHLGEPADVLHEMIPADVHIDVHIVKKSAKRNCHTLVTSGMSDQPMPSPASMKKFRYAELMICLPPTWPMREQDLSGDKYGWPVTWLNALAHAPFENGIFLGANHTVPNGDPPQPLTIKHEAVLHDAARTGQNAPGLQGSRFPPKRDSLLRTCPYIPVGNGIRS